MLRLRWALFWGCVVAAPFALVLLGSTLPGEPAARGRLEVPSFTAWGKIFSFLLLGALGVAYLVWRRPMVQARAILETSPLGSSQAVTDLVDWTLFLKVLLVTEAVTLTGVLAYRVIDGPLSTFDAWGVAASGSIVAFVIHLLFLARRQNRQ